MGGFDTTTVDIQTASRQWRERPADQRYQTLDELSAAVTARRDVARGLTTTTESIQISPDLQLLLPGESNPAEMTAWSFGQVAASVGAPARYLRTLPDPIAQQALSYGLQHRDDTREESKLYLIPNADETALELRAATAPTYGRIFDAEVVAVAQDMVRASGGAFDNPLEWGGRKAGLYASDRDVFMFLVDGGSIVDGGSERDQLNRGIFLWNSEVGAATFGFQTFFFRAVCGNHLIWGAENVKALKIRHTSGAPARFVNEVFPALQEYIRQSTGAYEDAIQRAKKYRMPITEKEQQEFLEKQGFTKAETKRALALAAAEEGSTGSLWDVIQGFTAAARQLAHVDARVSLERRAGKLMELSAAA